jgi:hypothetical protein
MMKKERESQGGHPAWKRWLLRLVSPEFRLQEADRGMLDAEENLDRADRRLIEAIIAKWEWITALTPGDGLDIEAEKKEAVASAVSDMDRWPEFAPRLLIELQKRVPELARLLGEVPTQRE